MKVSGFKVLAARETAFEINTVFWLMLVSGILLLASGCGKKTDTGPTAAPAASNGPASASEVDLNAVLRDLTQAVRKYSVEHKKVPKTLNEVVAAGYVQHLPTAPPGKKFEIYAKSMQVVLVKQ